MNNQRFAFAAVVVLGSLGFAEAGCLLGSDPDKNSQVLEGLGGTPGTAGTSGGVGGGGGVNDQIVGTPIATFDATTESFNFSSYDEVPNLALHNGGTPPTIDFDDTDASPMGGGSLKVFAPYTGANQYVDVQARAFPTSMLQNWAGGKLHVRVKVDPGSTFNGQVQPYALTTAGFVFVGSALNVMTGPGWHDYVVTLNSAMTRNNGYDLTQVITYGVHIGSGTAGAAQRAVTFHIDSFTVEGVTLPARDAGSDAGAGGGSDAPGDGGGNDAPGDGATASD